MEMRHLCLYLDPFASQRIDIFYNMRNTQNTHLCHNLKIFKLSSLQINIENVSDKQQIDEHSIIQ